MLKHVFIAVSREDVNEALEYYSLHGKQKRMLRRGSVSVDDELVLSPHGLRIFLQIPAFVQKLGRQTDAIDYYGRTIFPPESVELLISRMESEGVDHLPGWKWLYELLTYAKKKGFYIVHLGI